jgi:hypothetical protein
MAEKAEDLSLPYFQIDSVQHFHIAIAMDQAFDLDNRVVFAHGSNRACDRLTAA